jgi:hypothetical protein
MWKTDVIMTYGQPTSVKIIMDQKQPENVGYFSCSGSIITNDAGCVGKIKSRIAIAIAAYSKNNSFFTSKLN